MDERSFFLLLLLLPGIVFARLPIFRSRSIVNYERASACWKRVLFTSDAENVYPGCSWVSRAALKSDEYVNSIVFLLASGLLLRLSELEH